MGNLLDHNDKPDNYYSGSRLEMVPYVPVDAMRILDVGCGAGEFGNALKFQRCVEVWGIELCEQAAEEAQGKLDRVLVGSIEGNTMSLPEGYFDCVVFNDVIEHLVNPWAVLTNIKTYMQADAYVVASIPNVRYFNNIKTLLKHKQWKYEDEGILDKTHLRFFTIESIKELFISCSYNIIKIEGIRGRQFPWKFRLINMVMRNCFDDMRYMQFACLTRCR
ncbi:class I SAM-dependent methyltransferase [Geobacter grbiciae]|uniref:class I SAM-dependent methyltransferase n=1 Tax=Geobacter grbiciae TaxID=155042 RepID=UPI001C018F4F|nr:class I SAM-dependent methyltransferase [Geobacter grbiciae]MBT1074660.1 class I SAM-dependent methyltransferase [Geobacter grbiciae]